MSKETIDDLKKAQTKTRRGGPAMMNGPAPKAKNFKGSMTQLGRYLRAEYWRLGLVVACAIVGTVFAITSPKILGNATTQIVDDYISMKTYDALKKQIPREILGELPRGTKVKNLPREMTKIAAEKIASAKASAGEKIRAEISAKIPQNVPNRDEAVEQISAPIIREANAQIDQKAAAEQKKSSAKNANSALKKLSSAQRSAVENIDITGARPGIHWEKVGSIALWLIALYLLSSLFTFAQGWIASGITQRLAFRLRREMSAKINKLPLRYFDSKPFGDVLSRITNDVDLIQQSLSQSLSNAITAVATIVGIVAMMFTISWQMTLIALTVIPVSMAFILVVVKKSQKYFLLHQTALGALDGQIEENYGGHGVVQVFGAQKSAAKNFARTNEKLYASAWKSQFLSGLMWPITNVVGNLGYVAVAVVGGWLAIDGKVSIGDIQAFIQYVQQLNQPLIQIANIGNVMQSTAAAAERVFEFLGEENEPADPENVQNLGEIAGAVEFRKVKFSYEKGSPIIKHFSAKVAPGQTVAIVGPTGAGKTTMVNLLMRFYDPDSGEILIDGTKTRDLKRADVRRKFAMVLQDTWLFSGTVRENLAYGRHGASDAEIRAIAKSAHVDHFIESLPEGYDTLLDEDAENISAGEKQLLTIARAMLADPPMLILDEATSNVDTRTEQRIQESMTRLMRGRTSFVIAHRLSTIRDADLILVMDHGDIIESGNHAELLARGGFYAKLYNSQFDAAG